MSQVRSPPQALIGPFPGALSNGEPGTVPGPGARGTKDDNDVRTSSTAPAVVFVPTNARCTGCVRLDLQLFPVQLLPCQVCVGSLSFQEAVIVTVLAPGLARIGVPLVDHT